MSGTSLTGNSYPTMSDGYDDDVTGLFGCYRRPGVRQQVAE